MVRAFVTNWAISGEGVVGPHLQQCGWEGHFDFIIQAVFFIETVALFMRVLLHFDINAKKL